MGPSISVGEKKALKAAADKWWVGKTARQVCTVQLFTKEMCCPTKKFLRSLEVVLKESFGSGVPEGLGQSILMLGMGKVVMEYGDITRRFLGKRPAPTKKDILALLKTKKAA